MEIVPGTFVPSYYKKLLTFEIEGKGISDLDIFEVHRVIVKCLGREPKILTQADGGLLVEVASSGESS